jgi:hypothetical protein
MCETNRVQDGFGVSAWLLSNALVFSGALVDKVGDVYGPSTLYIFYVNLKNISSTKISKFQTDSMLEIFNNIFSKTPMLI